MLGLPQRPEEQAVREDFKVSSLKRMMMPVLRLFTISIKMPLQIVFLGLKLAEQRTNATSCVPIQANVGCESSKQSGTFGY